MQGIYYLELNNLFYIGRSHDIEFRISRHHQLLGCGTHPNPKILKAWYEGGSKLEYGIIEPIADAKILPQREIFWIDEFDAVHNGLNMPYKNRDEQNIMLLSPDGILVSANYPAELCRQYNLDNGAISRLIHGKLKQHKGWTLKQVLDK